MIALYSLTRPLFIILFFVAILSACKNDDSQVNPYSVCDCCSTEPLQVSLDTGQLFIPNIISPNNDGSNDLMDVFGVFPKVNFITLKDQKGAVIFKRENFLPNNPSGNWDGKDLEGNLLTGVLDYDIGITSYSGQYNTFSGKICSFECGGKSDFPISNLPNCAFPAQHDGEGYWDKSLPTYDENCF